MIQIITYLSGFLTCALLWALRERERRPRFEALAEENEKLREQKQARRQKAENIRKELRGLREEFSLGGKALPPASAKSNGAAIAIRTTTQLPDLANFAGSR